MATKSRLHEPEPMLLLALGSVCLAPDTERPHPVRCAGARMSSGGFEQVSPVFGPA